MTKADIRPRVARALGFWFTMTLGTAVWFGAIFWMLLHSMTGPR